MNWMDVGKAIAPLAPTIGGIMGGLIPFPGGAMIGQALGNIVARQFGVPATPEAVSAAVKGSPNELAIAKLNAATEEAKAQYPAIAEIEKALAHEREVTITQINETMRAELGSDSLFKSGWRPMNGWVMVYLIAIVGSVMVASLILFMVTGNSGPWDKFVNALPSITLFLALPAAVSGITSFGRSWERYGAFKAGPSGEAAVTITKPATAPGKR